MTSNTAPLFSFSALGARSFIKGGAAVVLDRDVHIVDAELAAQGHYAGAKLVLARDGGANAEDMFYAVGALGPLTGGGNLVYAGVIIGTVNTNSGGTLDIRFNDSATQSRLDATLESIAYANLGGTPPAAVQVNWNFSDGNSGGNQGSGGKQAATGSTTVRIASAEEVLGTTSTTGAVSVGDSVTGRIEAADGQSGDQDWYQVVLVAGHRYRFDLQGADSNFGSLPDPYLRLLDPSGAQLAFDDDAPGTRESSLTYAATGSGIHYLSAQGFGSIGGTFTLTAVDLGKGADDVAASIESDSVLAVGGSVVGAIDADGEQDWYRVSLVAGHHYRFDLQGAGSNHGTLVDSVLRLRDASGTQISYNDDAGGTLESSIAFSPDKTATYFVSVQGYALNTGDFTLSASDVTGGVGDVPATIGTASAVAVGGSATGTIDASGDQDWYRVELLAGQKYRFELEGAGSNRGSLDDPELRLLDSTGLVLTSDDNSGHARDSKIDFTPAQAGTYLLSAQGYSSAIGTYELRTTDISGGAPDVAASVETLSAVFMGGGIAGSIDVKGDQDWYWVSLVAGHHYRFELRGFDSGGGSLGDPSLRLLDNTGKLIKSDDDSGNGLEALIAYSATETGDYLLSTEGFAGGGTGTFVLDAIDTTADIGASPGTRSAVTLGTSVSGSIDNDGDQDWYRVSLIEGHRYAFDLQGLASEQGTLADPVLQVLDFAGTEIAFDDDAGKGADSSIAFTASQSGAHLLAARSYNHAIGSFALRAVDFDDLGDVVGGTGTSTSIPMNGSLNGTIDVSGDRDWYRVSLIAGREYRFDLQGAASNHGSLLDPDLYLRNAAGDELAHNDDIAEGMLDSSISFTPSESGPYFVAAQAFATSNGVFRLSATDVTGGTGDVPGNTGTSHMVVAGDAVAGTIAVDGDADWYRIALVAGGHYRFDLQGEASNSGTLGDPYLRLYSSAGVAILSDDDSGTGLESSIAFSPDKTDTYFVSAQGGSATADGTFVLYAVDTALDVPANAGSTHTVTVGGAVTGVLETSGDRDWYRIALYAGHAYRFDLKGADSSHGSLGDPKLRLYNLEGMRLAEDDDSGDGHDSSVTFTPSLSANYMLSVEGPLGTGSFTLNAVDLDSAEAPANTSSASLLSSGSLVAGAIDAPGDQDWYRILLVEGQAYRFTLQGSDSSQGTLADPYLVLLDSLGQRITSDDSSGDGADSSLDYTAGGSGTYFVSAQGVSSHVGTYVLSATGVSQGTDDIPGGASTVNVVPIGSSVTGVIEEPGEPDPFAPLPESGANPNEDQDWYQVALVAEHRYRFDLQGSASNLGTLLDPYLRLLDNAGVQIATDDDSGRAIEAAIVYSATRTGVYYLSAQGAASSVGTFTLKATDLTGTTLPQIGSKDGDVMIATEFDDNLQGLAGADQLEGKGGNDWLTGDAGGDTLGGGFGDDTLIGGDGDDVFLMSTWGTGGDDALDAGAGNDRLGDYFGHNVLDGGAGDDHFSIYIADKDGTNIVSGGAGRDSYEILPRPFSFSDLAYVILDFEPGIGGDLLDVRELIAASSRERYFVDGSSLSSDFLRLLPSGANLLLQWDRDGVAQGAYDWVTQLTLSSVDATQLSSANYLGDIDVGSKGADAFLGSQGNDTLLGANGNDSLSGGVGADSLIGGSGADVYYVDDQKDEVIETDNQPEDSNIDFRSGLDLGTTIDKVVASISYALTNYVEQLTLAGGASGMTGTGNDLDNLLTDNSGANALRGLGGADTLVGAAGNDNLDGGAGTDVASYSGIRSAYVVTSIAGGFTVTDNDSADGNEGTDTLSGIERLVFADSVQILGSDVNFLAYDWKSHKLLGGVAISGASQTDATDSSGGASFAAVTATSLPLAVTRAVTTAESEMTDAAVNLQDAIAILKMIVGLEVNGAGKPLSPYQALAADFDGNDTVQLTDAIGVLKHVVGLTAPSPVWYFASETDTELPRLSALSPGAAPAISIDLTGVISPAHAGLVAYLSGDVDGSFPGAGDALDLDQVQSNYFTTLTQTHGLNLAQFGIYA